MRFAALNKEGSEGNPLSTPSSRKGRPTREAQESECLRLYHDAIQHQRCGQFAKAKALYQEVLGSEVMEEAEEEAMGDIKSNTILKLKYLIYKNLAAIAREEGDFSAAVDAYIEASSMDSSDVTMWCQLASVALLLGNLLMARTALEQALHCNEQYWPAIESLCTVLFALQDFTACLQVIRRGLQLEPEFPRGLAYLQHIFLECPDLTYPFMQLRVHLMNPRPPESSKYLKEAAEMSERREQLCQVKVHNEPISPPKKLGFISIYSLGKCLLSVYHHCKELSKTKPSFVVRVDLSAITDGAIEGTFLTSSPTKKPFPFCSGGSPKHSKVSDILLDGGHQSSGDEGGVGGGWGGGGGGGGGGSRRESKRKLTEGTEPFAPKRRSTRVKSKKKEHRSYFDMLRKYLPLWMQLSDLPEISELSPLRRPKASLPEYVKSARERLVSLVVESAPRLSDVDTVRQFLDKHQNNCGIINLMFEFVLFLATHYNWKWAATSFPTVKVFLDVYELLHPHLSYPSPFCSPDDPEAYYVAQLAIMWVWPCKATPKGGCSHHHCAHDCDQIMIQIALCYVELHLDNLHRRMPQFSSKAGTSTPTASKCFHECLTFAQMCSSGLLGSERKNFELRVFWCMAKWKTLQKDNEAAIQALRKCKAFLQHSTSESSDSKRSSGLVGEGSTSEPMYSKTPSGLVGEGSTSEAMDSKTPSGLVGKGSTSEAMDSKTPSGLVGESSTSEAMDSEFPSGLVSEGSTSEAMDSKTPSGLVGEGSTSEAMDSKTPSGLVSEGSTSEAMDSKTPSGLVGEGSTSEAMDSKTPSGLVGEGSTSEAMDSKTPSGLVGKGSTSEAMDSKTPSGLVGESSTSEAMDSEFPSGLVGEGSTSEAMDSKTPSGLVGEGSTSEAMDSKTPSGLVVSTSETMDSKTPSGLVVSTSEAMDSKTPSGLVGEGSTSEAMDSKTPSGLVVSTSETMDSKTPSGLVVSTSETMDSKTPSGLVVSTSETMDSKTPSGLVGEGSTSEAMDSKTPSGLVSEGSTSETTDSKTPSALVGEAVVSKTPSGLVGEGSTSEAVVSKTPSVLVGEGSVSETTGSKIPSGLVGECSTGGTMDSKALVGTSGLGNKGEESSPAVYLCNCEHDQIISIDHIDKKITLLEQSLSLEQIHQLFACGNYSTVVDKLLPVLDQESGTISEFLIGSEKKSDPDATGLLLLLDSLLKLNRTMECLQCCVQALLELVLHYQMGNEQWVTALRNTFNRLERCLNEDKKGELLDSCDARLLRRLVICVLKTMDITYDMSESQLNELLLCMPVCIPWKIFYLIISSDVHTVAASSRERTPAATSSQERTPSATSSRERTPAAASIQERTPAAASSRERTPAAASSQERTPAAASSRERTPAATSTEEPMETNQPPAPPTDSPSTRASPTAVVEQTPSPTVGTPAKSPVSSNSSEDPADLKLALQFLKEAHNHLGSMGWCCRDGGCFLLTSVDVLRKELRILTALPPKHRQLLLLELEQCYFCLYGHPNKKAKSRGLQDHGAEQISLTWEAALILIEYYHPPYFPSIGDAKSIQVTSELITLYKRITDVIPDVGQVTSMEALNDFIEGNTTSLPEPRPSHQHSSRISEVYYLLADDCLKSGDNHKAIRLYLQNLCYNPSGFDSWAGLALARSRKIMEKLNMRDVRSGMKKYVQLQAEPTVRCFEKAVTLNDKHCYVMEKFGFFCYAVQSFASQVISQPELFTAQNATSWAVDARRRMLQLSENCFLRALSLEGTKHAEPWIYCLMLGKIGCKLGRPAATTLQHLLKSAEILRRDGATYPEYVEIHAKGHAIEAIEVHYQLHTCALKYLVRENKDQLEESEPSILNVVSQVQQLPLGRVNYPGLWKWVGRLVGEARGVRVVQEESPGDLSSEASRGSSSRELTLSVTPPMAQALSTSIPPAEAHVPPPPSLPSSEQLEDLMDTFAAEANMESVVNEMDTSEAPEQQQTTASVGNDNGCGPVTCQESVVLQPEPVVLQPEPVVLQPEPVVLQPELQRTIEDSLVEAALATQKENEQSIQTGSSLIPETLKTASPPPKPAHCIEHVSSNLLQQCIYSIAVCAVRCPSHFKPRYRLAAVLAKIGQTKLARQVLLAPLPHALVAVQERLQPLFVLRANIFSNMWQIPNAEINRPGSFSTHARRNLELLFQVLIDLRDSHCLISLAQQLRSRPDVAKQYMRENERVAMFKKAVKHCVAVLKVSDEGVVVMSSEQLTRLLLDAYTTKGLSTRAEGCVHVKAMDDLLLKLYTALTARTSTQEGTPRLEDAIRFCQAKQKGVCN